MFIRHLCFINLHIKHIGKLVINMEIIITIEGINHEEVGKRRQKRNWKKQNTKVNIVSIKKSVPCVYLAKYRSLALKYTHVCIPKSF